MDLSDKIKILRNKLELTLDDVARKAGVSASTIMRYEKGQITNLKRDKLKALADALETTPAYLMGWTDDPVNYDNVDDVYVPSEYKKQGMGVKEYLDFKKAEEEDALKEQSLYASTYTDHDREVIEAYRNQPEMQPAVDRILGIGQQEKSKKLESVSLEDGSEYMELVARGGKYKVKKEDVLKWAKQLDLDDYEEDHDLC